MEGGGSITAKWGGGGGGGEGEGETWSASDTLSTRWLPTASGTAGQFPTAHHCGHVVNPRREALARDGHDFMAHTSDFQVLAAGTKNHAVAGLFTVF